MAGLSLECGDCKTQFRSVEEAQEHAELTGHANFQESTEPVCTSCITLTNYRDLEINGGLHAWSEIDC